MSEIPYAALIGLDWADQNHDVCLYDCTTHTQEHCVIGARPEAIEAWAMQLRVRYGGRPIAVCLEQKRGPLIYALCKYEFLVLYPVNPQTVSKYRQAFTPSRAKDDPTVGVASPQEIAELQVELLVKHRDKLSAWQPASPALRQLQALVEWRRTLIEDIGRTTNRLVDVLKGYFPQAIDCFEHRDTFVFCDFLTQWSSLSMVQQVSDEQLQQFFCKHHSRYKDCNARRIECLRNGIALTQDPAIVESSQLMVQALVSQLRSLLTSVRQFESEIDRLFNQLPDAAIFAALPHAGTNLAPRLLLAFGEDRTRYQSAQDLLQYAGIAPVTERSGKKCWVHWQASPEGGFPSVGNWRAGEHHDSYAKPSLSGRMNRAKLQPGQRRFIKLKNRLERRIKLRFEHWRSSGFAFCFAAGKTEFRMMKPSISWCCIKKVRRSHSKSSHKVEHDICHLVICDDETNTRFSSRF